MFIQKERKRLELLQGTLDLLILRTLIFGPRHGQGIGHAIQQTPRTNCWSSTGPYIPRFSAWKSPAGVSKPSDLKGRREVDADCHALT
jgi:hypothetical protein